MRDRFLRRLTAGALTVMACGCGLVKPAPQGTLRQMLAPREAQWNPPLRLTARAQGALEGDYSEQRRRLVFASRETGAPEVWLQEDAPLGLEPPRVLAPHSARDRWPRLSPEGQRIVFTSSREDPGGDIWLLDLRSGITRGLLRTFALGKDLQKLTGPQTADDQPCWHPGGKMIFFASAPSLQDPYDVWQLNLKDGTRSRLTTSGGQMPDCSPDGRYLLFASRGAGKGVGITVMRLSDRAVVPLTDGACIDLMPCWSSDGRRVMFARYAMDTDGDVDLDDAASVFSVTFDEAVFGSKGLPPARQLTSWAFSDTSPRPVGGGFLFASDRAALDGRRSLSLNLWALPMSGEMPEFARVSEFVQFARGQEGEGEVDVWRRLLAWHSVLWAARESAYSGKVEFDLPARGDAAEALLRTADLLTRLGRSAMAREALAQLLTEFPDSRVSGGLARVRLLELDRDELGRHPPQEPGSEWEQHLDAAQTLLKEYVALAQSAEDSGAREEAAALRDVCALAQLETGVTLQAMKRYNEALEALGRVADGYPKSTEACARALLATAGVFELLGEPETVRKTYLRLLQTYPDAEPYASRAAALVVDSIAGASSGQTLQDKLSALRALIEEYKDVRVLPALAENRIGDLFYEAKDYHSARQAYARTIEDYGGEVRQVAAAHLALAAIQTDQEDYALALETYSRLRGRLDELGSGERETRRRALDGYINATLMKAQKELDEGDVKLALSTYSGLIEFDPSLPAGHRGLVDCLARLGRTEEAILRYRPAAERDARDDVARFALARAYSYYGPEDWVGDRSAARRRAAIDREALRLVGQAILLRYDVSYYHQLRGFLFNRVALATSDDAAKVQALDAYLTALALSDPVRDRLNHANLLFNVAEGYMLTGQDENACDYYEQALAAGFSLKGKRGDAALEDISRSAIARGSYQFAAQMLREALDRLSGPLPDDERERRAVLVRRARLLDQMALTHYLDGDYAGAADYYQRDMEALRDLMADHPAGRAGYMRNLLRAQRNQAVNIYQGVRSGALEPAELEHSYGLLLAAVEEVERAGVVESDEEAPGIVTIDIQVAIGEEGGLAKFDLSAERRLLYTYLGRISADAGDYTAAAGFLRKKLALYPDLPPDTERRDVLSEQAVVLSQLADCLVRGGDLRGAADAFGEAMNLEQRAGNLRGEMADCFSLGRIALRMANVTPDTRAMSQPEFHDWCAKIADRHEALLGKSTSEGGPQLVQLRASLGSNLVQLRAITGAASAQEGEDGKNK